MIMPYSLPRQDYHFEPLLHHEVQFSIIMSSLPPAKEPATLFSLPPEPREYTLLLALALRYKPLKRLRFTRALKSVHARLERGFEWVDNKYWNGCRAVNMLWRKQRQIFSWLDG
jgi:hypothetical protein